MDRERGLARPFSTGRATKLLDYPAFYFHEFRGTSAWNHNQLPLPGRARPSVAYYGLLVVKVTIATRRVMKWRVASPYVEPSSRHGTHPKVSRADGLRYR